MKTQVAGQLKANGKKVLRRLEGSTRTVDWHYIKETGTWRGYVPRELLERKRR